MTLCWLAAGLAVLCWPVPRLTERRLRWLAVSERLVAPRSCRLAERSPRQPSGRLVFAIVAAITATSALTVSIPVAAAVAAATGTVGALVLRVTTRRRDTAADVALAGAVGLLCAELAVGSSRASALRAAADLPGPWQRGFGRASEAAARGDDPMSALRADTGPSHPAVQALITAWGVSDRTGTALAGVMSRVEADLTARRDQSRQLAVAVAGARSSAALLAGLPLLGIGLGSALGARPLALLFGSTSGQVLLAVGVVLDVLGVMWTARIIDGAERP
jgi:tight adherence protein B